MSLLFLFVFEMESVSKILPQIIVALIGILGVVLGFFLNIFASKGKIKIFINEFRKEYSKRGGTGGYLKAKESDNNISLIGFFYDIDLYNSSSDFRIIRNFKMISKKNDIVNEYDLKDSDTTEHHRSFIKIETLSCINVPPKSVKASITSNCVGKD